MAEMLKRVGRPYAPLLVVAAAFVLVTAVVSPYERSEQKLATSVEVPFGPGTDASGPAGSRDDDAGADGTTTGTQQELGGESSTAGGTGDSAASTEAPQTAGGVQRCSDREQQVPVDPYSPPCITFSGDNGGATHRGVTEDEIVVTMRILEGPSAAELFAELSGDSSVSSSLSAYRDTVVALGEYFSQTYQFYGRSLRFEFFTGSGSGQAELTGGGRDRAFADAVRASEENPFADLSAITIPYADALSRQEILNVGTPYPSRDWFNERSPYAWSLFPSGDVVVEAQVDWMLGRLLGQETADYAGPGLQGKPRKYAVIAPENADYQGSVSRRIQLLEEAGIPIERHMQYKLELSSMPNQASNIIAQLKDAGVTSVLCACDPVMLALGMTPKANEQGYHPEWVTAGHAFTDQDIVAQLIDSRQWQRAFGMALNAEQEPLGASLPYRAYKTMRPNDEPAFGVEEIYYQMLILALGIHLAGPNLTYETFQAGLYSYPGGQGPRGLWTFGPGNHTPTEDFREIWWDPEGISAQNNRPGTWVELNNGARYRPGETPRQPAPYFQR